MTFFSSSVRQPDGELLDKMADIGRQIGQFIQRKQAEFKLQQTQERLPAVIDKKYGWEKIKTIGDAYMMAGGIPTPNSDRAEAIPLVPLDMQQAIAHFHQQRGEDFSIPIGIHTGSVVAGVIGIKKFIYDLWGDTVNTASRMESHRFPGYIQVS